MNIFIHRLVSILILIAVCFLAVNFSGKKSRCNYEREDKVVQGASLRGLIEDGARVTLLRGYYKCNAVNRGDVVAFHAGKPDLIVKSVVAIPLDVWGIVKRAGGNLISVNGVILRNATGDEYRIDDRATRLLELYIRNYNGVVPPESYLLLGTATGGSYDSTSIGLVGFTDIVGKIQL